MEAAATSSSFAVSHLPKWPPRFHFFPSLSFPPQTTVSFSPAVSSLRFKSSPAKRLLQSTARKERSRRALRASSAESPSTDSSGKWLLEPIGDGDSRHIGYKVPLPDAFEIASNAVTVGRLPEKADMVIPVATVSGLHARLEKKEGTLLVTDLDSTNGTYVGDKKLKPGTVTPVTPGSLITFGDTHLAMFRLSKIEEPNVTSKSDEPDIKPAADVPADNGETGS